MARAVQVPPDGQPVVLLADHPTTGGYPVIGVVDVADLAALAQAGPGTTVRMRRMEADMSIDLNSDLGEGFGVWRLGDDAALLRIVTSANAACGFHAGDLSIMRTVAIGRLPTTWQSAPRCPIATSPASAAGPWTSPPRADRRRALPLGALDGLCRVAGTRVRYVTHGALYNTVVDDGQAKRWCGRSWVRRRAAVLGLFGSALLRHAERAGPQAVAEGFADRAYTRAASSCRALTLLPSSPTLLPSSSGPCA